jgi:hypothetical protein
VDGMHVVYYVHVSSSRLVVIELSILGVAFVELICKLHNTRRKKKKQSGNDFFFGDLRTT